MPVRKCGDVVRAVAAEKGITPDRLSLKDHHDIDAESVDWVVRNSAAGIIEGRFLDCVLGKVSSLIHVVHVGAGTDVRAGRWEVRRPGVDGFSEVMRQDEADEQFRLWVYPGAERLEPRTNIDTTEEAGEWANLLKYLPESS